MLAVRLLEGVSVLAACIECSMCGGVKLIGMYIYIGYGSTYVYVYGCFELWAQWYVIDEEQGMTLLVNATCHTG